jgi:hypothetical protein
MLVMAKKPAKKPVKKPAPRESARAIYQLKADLRYIKPPIWRRIQVWEDTSLERLHDILQIAFGWTNSHLHEFEIDGRTFGMDLAEIDAMEGDPVMEDESKVRLNQVVLRLKSRFTYTYDFGDSWLHDITLERILPSDPALSYPRCIDGLRSAPPEDCGGPPGYENYLKAIADPKHPEHEEMLDWSGAFDPEAFSTEEVNRSLTGKRGRSGR